MNGIEALFEGNDPEIETWESSRADHFTNIERGDNGHVFTMEHLMTDGWEVRKRQNNLDRALGELFAKYTIAPVTQKTYKEIFLKHNLGEK